MIRVTIEMLPHGDASRAYRLGEVTITNDGTGTNEMCDYDVKLTKEPPIAKTRGIWKRGRVEGFARQRLGPYDLLLRALVATVGDRNRQYVRSDP